MPHIITYLPLINLSNTKYSFTDTKTNSKAKARGRTPDPASRTWTTSLSLQLQKSYMELFDHCNTFINKRKRAPNHTVLSEISLSEVKTMNSSRDTCQDAQCMQQTFLLSSQGRFVQSPKKDSGLPRASPSPQSVCLMNESHSRKTSVSRIHWSVWQSKPYTSDTNIQHKALKEHTHNNAGSLRWHCTTTVLLYKLSHCTVSTTVTTSCRHVSYFQICLQLWMLIMQVSFTSVQVHNSSVRKSGTHCTTESSSGMPRRVWWCTPVSQLLKSLEEGDSKLEVNLAKLVRSCHKVKY